MEIPKLLGYAEIIAQRKTYKKILWRTFLIHDLTAIIFMKIMAIYFCYNNQNSCNTVPKRQSCKSFCQCPVLVRYHPAMLSFFWLRSFPFLVQFYSTINSYFTTQASFVPRYTTDRPLVSCDTNLHIITFKLCTLGTNMFDAPWTWTSHGSPQHQRQQRYESNLRSYVTQLSCII